METVLGLIISVGLFLGIFKLLAYVMWEEYDD
jgi:hypothetical protein